MEEGGSVEEGDVDEEGVLADHTKEVEDPAESAWRRRETRVDDDVMKLAVERGGGEEKEEVTEMGEMAAAKPSDEFRAFDSDDRDEDGEDNVVLVGEASA